MMSYTDFKKKCSSEIYRENEFLDRVLVKRGLGGLLNNVKWVKLLHTLVVHHNLIRECRAKLIWEEHYTGRLLCIDENIAYQFDYYDQAMEAMITGKPHGWWAYKEIEWLEFPRHLTGKAGKQNLVAIQSALASVGQIPLVLTDTSLRLEAYRVTAT